jgi:DNA-binding response OmpR family regulator
MTAMTDPRQPLIMIVDRDLGKLTTLDSLLARKGGFLITTCSTVADAQRAAAGRKVDLVLIGKLGDKGEEVALTWKVKDINPATKVLILHESDDWAGSIAPLDPGADDLLSAPYTEDELLKAVQGLLDRPLPPADSA